ncbi:MAG: hypothetical protein WD396_10735, partial [Pseudohongiellaceae bacterium]
RKSFPGGSIAASLPLTVPHGPALSQPGESSDIFKLSHYQIAQELDFITNGGTIAALEQSEQANPHSICGSLTPPHPAIPQTVV